MLSFIFTLILCGLAFSAQVTVTLKAKASVDPGVVSLGQIAEIKGDPNFTKKLLDLEVGKVAEAGRKTRITEKVIKGFFVNSVSDGRNIIFNGAKFCDVVARAGIVSSDSVKNILQKEVRSRMPKNLQEGEDWIFEAQKVPSLNTPENGGSISLKLSPNFSGIGNEVAVLQVLNGKKIISKHSIPFTIRRFEYVAELKNNIRKGEMLTENDFIMLKQETTFQKRKLIKKEKEAIGRTALRTLKSGEMLVDNALSTPYAVKEGEAVRIFTQIGGTIVQTNALAQKSAFKGQVITVKNIDTGKNILATVSGQGEAWVN